MSRGLREPAAIVARWTRAPIAGRRRSPAPARGANCTEERRIEAIAALRRLRMTGAEIAAAAEEHGLTVVHYDADFDLIASVTGQRCEWLVPAGGTH